MPTNPYDHPDLYDPEADSKNIGQHDDLGVHPEQRAAETDELNNLYNSPSTEEDSEDSLREAEENGDLYHPDNGDEEDSADDASENGFSYQDDSSSSTNSKKTPFFKNKKFLLFAGGGVGALLVVMIIISIFLSSLQTVHFATVLRSVGFARFNMYMNDQFSQTLFDSAVLTKDSTGTFELGDRSLLDRLRRINPEKQLTALSQEGTLEFKFSGDSRWGGLKTVNNFEGVNIKGTDVNLDEISQRIAGRNYNDLKLFDFKSKAQIRSQFVDEVMQNGLGDRLALEARSVRSSVFDGLRQASGIKMRTWKNAGKDYDGKTPKEAQTQSVEEGLQEVDNGGTGTPRSGIDDVQEAAEAERAAETTAAKEGKQITKKLSPKLESLNGTAKDVSTGVLVATVACIVHDLNNSFQETAKPREQQVGRFAHNLQTTSNQITTGQTNAVAVGAYNNRYNFADRALFYKQATGQKVTAEDKKQLADVPTVTPPSSTFANIIGPINTVMEASLGGPFVSVLENVPVVGGIVGGAKKKLIDVGCNVVLNKFFQFGFAAGEIGLAVFTAGTTETVAKAIEVGLKEGVKFAATVGVGELLGQLIQSSIDSYSGTDFSATNQGTKLYNSQAVATNYLEQTGNRQVSYGRPLSQQETSESQAQAMNTLRSKYSHQPLTERYFAIDNPFSLVGHVAAIAPHNLADFSLSGQRIFGSLAAFGGNIISQITQTFNSIFLQHNYALAAANTPDFSALGVNESGWSNAELQRLRYDSDFTPEKLAAYVEPRLDELNNKYSKCYTYVLQVDKPDKGCDAGDLSTEEALRWRAYSAKVYAAIELAKDYDHPVDRAGTSAGGSSATTTCKLDLQDSFGHGPINVSAIVLHYTATPKAAQTGVDGFVQAIKSNGGASVQLFVDKDGTCYQFVNPLNTLTYHAGGINDVAVGIEIEGDGEDQLMQNSTQFNSVVGEVRQLMKQFNVKNEQDYANRKGLFSHKEVDCYIYKGTDPPPCQKQDPGDSYMTKVKSALGTP